MRASVDLSNFIEHRGNSQPFLPKESIILFRFKHDFGQDAQTSTIKTTNFHFFLKIQKFYPPTR